MSSWVRSSAVPGVKPPPITNWNSPPAALNGFSNFPLQNILSLRTSIRILQGRRLNLIHIPIHLYAHFVQAILALVLPDPLGKRGVRTPNEEREYYRNRGKPQATDICNISVTSVECSIVCSTRQVERFFRPLVEMLSEEDKQAVSISEEEFVAIQVDGEGLDAGQRVLDLTSPLAMAGMSVSSKSPVCQRLTVPQLHFLHLNLFRRLHPSTLQKHQQCHPRPPNPRVCV